MGKKEFGLASVVKSIGLPVATEGYVIDYFIDGKWKHLCGTLIVNGTFDHPSDLDFALNIINTNAEKGVTRENVSHIMRIFDYEGDPNYLERACQDLEMINELLQKHEYKLIVVNREIFRKYNGVFE